MEHQPNIFFRIVIPFCIGIWVLQGVHFTKLNLLMYILVLSDLILMFIFNYLYRSIKVYHHKTFLAVMIYFFFFFMGGLCCLRHLQLADPDHFSLGRAEYLRIYIADEPLKKGTILRFKAKVTAAFTGLKKERAMGSLLITVRLKPFGSRVLNYGEAYLIPARYTSVPQPVNPAEFDSKSWLARQNIYQQAYLSEEELIPVGVQRGWSLIRFALALRKQQTGQYRKLIKDDDAFAVAATLILGYRANLEEEIVSAYSKTGTIHALSVSGMHVGIVYMVLEWALQWMNRKTALKWAKLVIILTLIWFYTLLTGYSASVLRSAIMLSMFILSKSLHRDTSSYHVLALSAFCLLLFDPFLLWDVGFQLSYLAVLGLVYLQPRIYKVFSFKWAWVQKVWSMISLSLAAQAFTFPFSIYYFHQFPVYFLLSNLFIALPVTLLMYAGLAILLFHLYWLAVPFEWLLIFMNRGLEHIAGLPYATIDSIWITKMELCLLCLLIFFMMESFYTKKKQYIFAMLFLSVFLQGMLIKDKIKARQQKEIIPFSLNRNYAVAFIRSGTAVLITDLLPGDRTFKVHIQPALDQRKISRITCIPWNKIQALRHTPHQLQRLIVGDHQLHFEHFSILLADSSFNHMKILNAPKFDAVWLHGDPKIEISELRKQIHFRKIWIDGTNHNYTVKQIEMDTLYFKGSTIVLKKIKASLINLNKYKPFTN